MSLQGDEKAHRALFVSLRLADMMPPSDSCCVFCESSSRDLSTSREFYTGVLGLDVDPQFDTPEVIVFDSTTIPFALRQSTVNLDEAV